LDGVVIAALSMRVDSWSISAAGRVDICAEALFLPSVDVRLGVNPVILKHPYQTIN
jgi:hypothetical protein